MPWYIWTYFAISCILAGFVGFIDEDMSVPDETDATIALIGVFFFWGLVVILIPYYIGKGIYKLNKMRTVKIEEKKTEAVKINPKMRHKL